MTNSVVKKSVILFYYGKNNDAY